MQPVQDAVGGPQHDGAVFEALTRAIGSVQASKLFADGSNIRLDGESLVLRVPSKFIKSWLLRRHGVALETVARNLVGPAGQLEVHVAEVARTSPAVPSRQVVEADPPEALSISPASCRVSGSTVPDSPDRRRQLDTQLSGPQSSGPHSSGPHSSGPHSSGNPRHETAHSSDQATASRRRRIELMEPVLGPANQHAFAAADRIVQEPGRLNPVLVHGTVGVGKTLLLDRVRRQLQRTHRELRVICLSAEAFANDFTRSLTEASLPAFRRRYRSVDVLVVDDIDFLNGKRVIQEEFLHTVDHLLQHGRQVVASSACHPKLMSRTSEEIIGRFVGGVVCRIGEPDEATRAGIAARKAAQIGLELEPRIAHELARRFRNPREIEGAVNSLATWTEAYAQPLTLKVVAEVVSGLERDCLRPIRMPDIERAVCEAFGVEPADLCSKRRHRTIATARQVAMYLAREHLGAALSEIGRHFGGRNHSTVVAARRRVQEQLKQHDSVRIGHREIPVSDLLDCLESRLRAG